MNDPSKASAAYQGMTEKWALPKTLMGGTPAMRQAGTRFLPKHPAENATVYAERAKRAVLRNYFRRTVQKLVGRVFSHPITLSGDVPLQLRYLLQDVDLSGRGLNSFAQSWFQDALICGISYALVDYPTTTSDTGRPYALHIPAENVIGWQWDPASAAPKLSQIRILEPTEEGGSEQVRFIEPDRWYIYRKPEKGDWQIVSEGRNSLGEIPLVPLYAGRTGLMQAEPPLEDLAYLNLEHYQIRSDQRNALNVASFPILAASGYDPEIDGPIEVGPNKVLTTSDTEGRYYYVESTGAALEAGARELADLEKAIAMFSHQFDPASVEQTATGKVLEAAENLNPIGAMVMEIEDSLNGLLKLFAKWEGVDDWGALQIQYDPVALMQNGSDPALRRELNAQN